MKKRALKAKKKVKKIRPNKKSNKISHRINRAKVKKKPQPIFSKFAGNPVLQPNPDHPWESKATFNPGALYEDGKVHLVYRAIGDSDMSVLGYASSKDGFIIDERLDKPVYVPREPFEKTTTNFSVSPASYTSGGGGWGGIEDPRLTKLGDKVYMLYTAYNGWDSVRIGLTSIPLQDFLQKHWNWTKSILISPPGTPAKNACLLPEKIKGKYVIFHRMHLGERVPPNILIDFVDDLDFKNGKWLQGQFQIVPRKNHWDSGKVGVGAPPIKTKDGWLFIYQGVGTHDPSRYKMGAMLLDLKDPTKVLARSKEPILEPQEWYENEGWKYGVIYPCGAVVIDNQLIVYYGGADRVVCAAVADLPEFLKQLKLDKIPRLHSVPLTVSRKPHAHR